MRIHFYLALCFFFCLRKSDLRIKGYSHPLQSCGLHAYCCKVWRCHILLLQQGSVILIFVRRLTIPQTTSCVFIFLILISYVFENKAFAASSSLTTFTPAGTFQNLKRVHSYYVSIWHSFSSPVFVCIFRTPLRSSLEEGRSLKNWVVCLKCCFRVSCG